MWAKIKINKNELIGEYDGSIQCHGAMPEELERQVVTLLYHLIEEGRSWEELKELTSRICKKMTFNF